MQDTPEAAPQGSFLGNVNIVAVTYAVDGLLALATGVLVARSLGAEGRGVYALFVLSAALAQLVLGLGVGNAAIYYLNKRELSLRDVVAAAHVVTLASLVITGVFVAAIAPWAGDRILGEQMPPWLFVLAVPALLHMNLLRLVLQGLGRFADLGIATVGQQAILLAAVAVAVAADAATPARVAGFLIIASAATAAFELLRIGVRSVDVRRILRPSRRVLLTLIAFGVQGEAGNVLQALNYRLDQFIVAGFVGLAGVGVYAVGVSMTEALFIVANAVALVLMPRLTSAASEEAARMTPVVARGMLLVAAAGALALALLAPLAIPPIFGEEFEASVQALWWLLPGTVALCGSKVLTSYIFSQGRPLVNTLVTCVSLAVTLSADLALVPVFGVNGAAAASTAAYVAHFGAALYAYQRMSGQPALDAVLPRPSDLQLYADTLRDALARLHRRGPVEAQG